MEKQEFYKYYLPALKKALEHEDSFEQFALKGPEFYIEAEDSVMGEIDNYINYSSGNDEFLNMVNYYFDAKSHGFRSIGSVPLPDYRKSIIDVLIERFEV